MRLSDALIKLNENTAVLHDDTLYVNKRDCISWSTAKDILKELRSDIIKEFGGKFELNNLLDGSYIPVFGFYDDETGLGIGVHRCLASPDFEDYCTNILVMYPKNQKCNPDDIQRLKTLVNRNILISVGVEGKEYVPYSEFTIPSNIINYIPRNVYIKPDDGTVKMGDIIPIDDHAQKNWCDEKQRLANLLRNKY